MALSLGRLPRYLVLDPVSTARFEVRLSRPACEIDVELENPKPGRSFLLLIGPQGGPLVQRLRLSGRARILFEPKDLRTHVLMLANPQREPLVLRIRGRRVGAAVRPTRPPGSRSSAPARSSVRPRRASPRLPRIGPSATADAPGAAGPFAGRLRGVRPKG